MGKVKVEKSQSHLTDLVTSYELQVLSTTNGDRVAIPPD